MAVNQLKAGAALNYCTIILSSLVGLLYTPYMLRMLGQSEYGLYSLVASVIAYLTVLDLGFGNAIVRYTAKFRAEGKVQEQYEMFGMFFLLYVVMGLIAFIAGLFLLANTESLFGKTMTAYELSRAKVMVIIMVANVAVTFPMSIFGSIITAYERFVFPKVISIIRVILNTVVMIVLLEMGYKALAMVIVQTVFNIITLFINFLYCKKELGIKLHFGYFKWDFLREVTIYSLWIFLNAIMDRVYWSTGQFVLGAVAGTIAVSVFAVAIHLQSLYLQFSTAISSVFLPKVTAMVAKNESGEKISNLFIRTGRIQNIVMSLLLFGFIVFGRQFIVIWAGKDYEDAYLMTLLFFISLYIPLIQNLGITILQARNQMKFRSIAYIIIAMVALAFEIIFAKMWGGLGCAIAVSGALLLGQGLVMNIYYHVKQGIDIPRFWMEILKMDIVPVFVTIAFIVITNKWWSVDSILSFVGCAFVYCVVYCLLYYKFSLNQYERDLVITPVKRVLKIK
ncbi:MAG: oligosaccharide flippase family protein [Bacteroidaceae bacterium]|nr:oligosaccharide flippase family protein [Bacteroidaceae bacterium]